MPQCRDFGLDAHLTFASSPRFGTKVLWRYSDAPSVEGVGLKVVQQSFDGRPPGDYVLFRFGFTNSGPAPVTFYAGMFADWDIGDDVLDDVGATEPGGRLMYMTNGSGGPLAGSLLLSDAPASGNRFFRLQGAPPPSSDYVAALAGDVRVPSVESPGDYLYLHGVGPITLAPNETDEVWIAIVAGDDLAQLRANAAAAETDVARRRAGGGDVEVVSAQAVAVDRSRLQIRRATSAICKAACKLD